MTNSRAQFLARKPTKLFMQIPNNIKMENKTENCWLQQCDIRPRRDLKKEQSRSSFELINHPCILCFWHKNPVDPIERDFLNYFHFINYQEEKSYHHPTHLSSLDFCHFIYFCLLKRVFKRFYSRQTDQDESILSK